MEPERQVQRPSRSKTFSDCIVLCYVGSLLFAGALFLIMVVRNVFNPDAFFFLSVGFGVISTFHSPVYFLVLRKKTEPGAFWTVFGAGLVGLIAYTLGFSLGAWRLALPVIGLWIGIAVARRWIPDVRLPGVCTKCGYDLRGLPEPRCPECGTLFDPKRPDLVR